MKIIGILFVIAVSDCLAFIPAMSLVGIPLPTGLVVFLCALLLKGIYILGVRAYRKLVRKFAEDVKQEMQKSA